MFNFIKRIFIWWQDCTLGTQWYTFRKGALVGSDDGGNRYYRSKKGDRRWVIYNGVIEASRVPPEWHAWLHRTADLPPTEAPPLRKDWEKDHKPNRTGTGEAYFPPGSLARGAARPHATGDYRAWTPEQQEAE